MVIRRLIAAIAAMLLAGVGAVLLLGYVGTAERRAMAGMETVQVLVVEKPVPEGTPGEQLLASRFIDPALLADPNAVKIPKGMQELSIALESQRVLGGELKPGATVGVFVSLAKEDERPAQTHLVLHKVLVSKVQRGASAQQQEGAGGDNGTGLPEGGLMVTLAVTAPSAEKIVFGAEHGKIWLSLEPAGADVAGTRVVTESSVYR